jgi:hypothetical protein
MGKTIKVRSSRAFIDLSVYIREREERKLRLQNNATNENKGKEYNSTDETLYEKETRFQEERLKNLREGVPVNLVEFGNKKGLDAETLMKVENHSPIISVIYFQLRDKWGPNEEKRASDWIQILTNEGIHTRRTSFSHTYFSDIGFRGIP